MRGLIPRFLWAAVVLLLAGCTPAASLPGGQSATASAEKQRAEAGRVRQPSRLGLMC